MKDYPPKLPKQELITTFAESLEDIIPANIQENLDYIKKLEEEYEIANKAIKKVHKSEGLSKEVLYFWCLWSELNYIRIEPWKKWLSYWLALYEKLPDYKPKPSKYDKKDFGEDRQRALLIPIEQFYEGKLRGSGSRLSGQCPFHDDSSPSFFIFRNQNKFHCFGCGVNGNVIDYVMKKKDLNFKDAMRFLL